MAESLAVLSVEWSVFEVESMTVDWKAGRMVDILSAEWESMRAVERAQWKVVETVV